MRGGEGVREDEVEACVMWTALVVLYGPVFITLCCALFVHRFANSKGIDLYTRKCRLLKAKA